VILKKDADLIVKNNDAFIKKEETINGQKVCQYTYLLASYKDFKNPVEDSDLEAFELRGLTFVEEAPGKWKRNLFLHKFFNINETQETLESKLKNKKIKKLTYKEDGSAITFIKIGDKIYGKTKFSFQSDQAIQATKIYHTDKKIKKIVDECIERDLAPLFEFVSPENKIVLPYEEERLILLQVRDNKTGEYLDIDKLFPEADKVKNLEIRPIEDLIEETKTLEGLEGYVVTFEDGMMLKLKTAWYLKIHHLVTDYPDNEHFIIKNILEETIDDVLSQIPEDHKETRNKIQTINNLIVNHINSLSKEIFSKTKEFNGDRKKFAERNKNYDYFGILMTSLRKPELSYIEELIKEDVAKKCKKQKMAIEYIKKISAKQKL